MTLFNQINSFLLGLFLLVMSSLIYFQFNQTKAFMDNQMGNDLNNTSNALALMLTPYIETGDVASAETIVNVVFEGGFYKQVNLTWAENNKTKEWSNPVKIEGVPDWFVDLDFFESQSIEKVIQNGWVPLATVTLKANTTIAYAQLWAVMRDTLTAMLVLFAVCLVVLRLRLKTILAPLYRISDQAKLIAKREFQPNLSIPETTELKEVVLAINSMSEQLQSVFTQLDKEVVSLKNEKLTDSVSQLPNRLHLNSQLESWIKEPGYGGLLIARLDWLEELDKQYGYQVRDNTIKVLAKELQEFLPNIAPCVIARISHKEFVFLVTKASTSKLREFSQSTIRLINQAMVSASYNDEKQFSIGIAVRTQGVTSSKLLANADDALQLALQNKTTSHWYDNKSEEDAVGWQTHLLEAIASRNFKLQWHPAMSFENDEVLQREVYSGLEIDGEVIRAADFMPYVEQLGLGSQFDQSLIDSITAHHSLLANQENIAINITQDSVLDLNFHTWLGNFLRRQKDAGRFYFEIQEGTVLSHSKLSTNFVHIIKQWGSKVGIDNCGREMGSLSYLQTIKPNYVKLDQSLSCNINNDVEVEDLSERLILTRAVINTARGLDIDVIITAIEDSEQLARVKPLKATGYQGFITPPSIIG